MRGIEIWRPNRPVAIHWTPVGPLLASVPQCPTSPSHKLGSAQIFQPLANTENANLIFLSSAYGLCLDVVVVG
jgi:hypothetical protein